MDQSERALQQYNCNVNGVPVATVRVHAITAVIGTLVYGHNTARVITVLLKHSNYTLRHPSSEVAIFSLDLICSN